MRDLENQLIINRICSEELVDQNSKLSSELSDCHQENQSFKSKIQTLESELKSYEVNEHFTLKNDEI